MSALKTRVLTTLLFGRFSVTQGDTWRHKYKHTYRQSYLENWLIPLIFEMLHTQSKRFIVEDHPRTFQTEKLCRVVQNVIG